MTVVGLALGAAGAARAARLVTALLYDVRPSDFWSIAAPLTFLLTACLLASVVPTLRATRVSPTSALRLE